jgi:hypothetical protein
MFVWILSLLASDIVADAECLAAELVGFGFAELSVAQLLRPR